MYDAVESQVCPFCKSLEFAVAEEPQAVAEEIAHVYVADLHSGENSEIDALLAKGWKIVSRFAKSYTLELPKRQEPQDEIPEAEQKLNSELLTDEAHAKAQETAAIAESTFTEPVSVTVKTETEVLSADEEAFFQRNPGLREKVEEAKRRRKQPDHIDDIVEAQKKGAIPK